MQCTIATLDLAARLDGTVCMYDDVPYYIRISDVYKTDDIYLYDFIDKVKVKQIKASDPLFDVATPPLGYMQFRANPGIVVHAERLPHRQFRQGVTPTVLHYQYFNGPQRVSLHTQYFRDMMTKKYDPFAESLKKIIDSPVYFEQALSNDCAVVKHVNGLVKLYFKHEEVGFSSVSELKKDSPIIHVPVSVKAWITKEYLSQFDWTITE